MIEPSHGIEFVKKRGHMKKGIQKLSVKVFALIIVCVIVPLFLSFWYVKSQYESYLQEQISDKIIQTMAKSEDAVYGAFQEMAGMSSAITANPQLRSVLGDASASYYARTKMFDNSIQTLSAANLYASDEMRITMFGKDGNTYANWGLNYGDYTFLLRQGWVQESIQNQGYVVWSLFNAAYAQGDPPDAPQYISLARSVLGDDGADDYLGTLIVSMPQERLGALLGQYKYSDADAIFVAVDGGEIVLRNAAQDFDTQAVPAVCSRMAGQKSGSMLQQTAGGEKLVSYYTLSSPWTLGGQALHVIHFTDYASVHRQMDVISGKMNILLLLCVAVSVFVAAFISVRMVHPIRALAHEMRAYRADRPLELQGIDLNRKDEVGHLNRSFVQMSKNITELFEKLKEEYAVREKYRYETLRAQVNPHFLFNTLNTIRYMAIMQHAQGITKSLDALADMLQYRMARGEETVPLADEIKNIESYLYIQNMRYGDRLQLETDFSPEVLRLRVVKFILQPIVENAVMHGFVDKSAADSCIIRIYGDREPDCLMLYVEDNGGGIDEKTAEAFNSGARRHAAQGKGLGLAGVDARIRAAYGDAFGLHIEKIPQIGTLVSYRLPVLEKGGDEDAPRIDRG